MDNKYYSATVSWNEMIDWFLSKFSTYLTSTLLDSDLSISLKFFSGQQGSQAN